MIAASRAFFEHLFGLYLYRLLTHKKHFFVLRYCLLLCVLFTLCWFVPFSAKVIEKVNDILGNYGANYPEIHLSSGKATYVSPDMPALFDLYGGGKAIFDTSGTITSLADYPEGSVLFTESGVQWQKDGLDSIDFKSFVTSQDIVI